VKGRADHRLPDARLPGHFRESEHISGHFDSEVANASLDVQSRKDFEPADRLEGNRVEMELKTRHLNRAGHAGPQNIALNGKTAPFNTKPAERSAVEVAGGLGRWDRHAAAPASSFGRRIALFWQAHVGAKYGRPSIDRVDNRPPVARFGVPGR
jgi:hypothetical protein